MNRFRYQLGNLIRFLSAPWQQWNISPEKACTIFGSNFGKSGWNHIKQTLEEYDSNNQIKAKDTTLWKFLKEFKPRNILEVAGVDTKKEFDLFTYPWSSFTKNSLKKSPLLSRFCGPSTDEFIEEEFKRIIALYKKLKKEGYKPYTYPNSFIYGTWLTSMSGASRFVVLQGNHRMSILSHLGYVKVKVRTHKSYLKNISESDLESWEFVKSGDYSSDEALHVFNLFFQNNGNHIKNMINKSRIL